MGISSYANTNAVSEPISGTDTKSFTGAITYANGRTDVNVCAYTNANTKSIAESNTTTITDRAAYGG